MRDPANFAQEISLIEGAKKGSDKINRLNETMTARYRRSPFGSVWNTASTVGSASGTFVPSRQNTSNSQTPRAPTLPRAGATSQTS